MCRVPIAQLAILVVTGVLFYFSILRLNEIQRRSQSDNSDHVPCVAQSKCSCTQPRQPSAAVDANSVDEFTQRLYGTQAAARRELLRKIRNGDDYSVLYSILAPEVECRNVVRLGALRDGGKWVCAPTRVDRRDCVFYSLGIHNEISFDTEFQHVTNQSCRYRAVDKEKQKASTLDSIHSLGGKFLQAFIANRTEKNFGRYAFVDVLEHFGDTEIDVLKMDIEGGEFAVADQLHKVPVCQLLVEIHGPTAGQTARLLTKLSQIGFFLYHFENNAKKFHLREYSFIHQNCLDQYGVTTVFGRWLS